MKRIIRLSVAIGESGFLLMALATPASAQSATGSSVSTSSSLPEAGTGSVTISIILFGLILAVIGVLFFIKEAKQKA